MFKNFLFPYYAVQAIIKYRGEIKEGASVSKDDIMTHTGNEISSQDQLSSIIKQNKIIDLKCKRIHCY